MLAFISGHSSVLVSLLLGSLTLVSEIMGLSKDPSAAKGMVDGLIKFIKDLGESSNPPSPPKA